MKHWILLGLLLSQSSIAGVLNKMETQRILRSIGILSMGNAVCNATLISNNLLLTNEHCVKEFARSCEVIQFSIHDEDGEVGTYGCEEILYHGDDNKPGTDYALVKLYGDPGFYHGYLKLADWDKEVKEPVKTGLDMWLTKFNPPTLVRESFALSQVKCSGTLHPDKPGAFKILPTHGEVPCQIQEGNSGSAFVNHKGHIVGLIAQGKIKSGTTYIQSMNDLQAEEYWGPTIRSIRKGIPNLDELIEKDVD